LLLAAALIALLGSQEVAPSVAPAGEPDDSYPLRHPRLLFSYAELPALRAKVRDGGADAQSYAYIRSRFTDHYLGAPYDTLLQNDFALEQIVNIGLAAYLEDAVDSTALELGRSLTLHIARNWAVDTDPFGTSLRLRALSIGFDLFFGAASAAERGEIRQEAQSYIQYMTTNINYDIWRRQPYVSNKSAMVSGALGLAAIAFHEEIAASYTTAALTAADETFAAWRSAHLDDGCYSEGSLYIGWSMRNLIYYFAARKRFDGVDFAFDGTVRAVENWVPYELDPRGGGRLNNIQDQTDYFLPLARHTTYWSWAQSAWGSAIAAYVWEHAAGAYGADMGDESDHAATVLWHTGVAPRNPGEVLPASRVWEKRGLYYYRSGWPDSASSDDVCFSFYSGAFQGGHAQEDQNQFTLAAYGEKLVLDHGAGAVAKQSEAHNIVRIDGKGQHNAGASIGTDGAIVSHITTDFADFVCGDASKAYSTHSPLNNAGVPYPWSDWSWGLHGANPVERALRRVVAVHGGTIPYFIIDDDLRKDAEVHRYDWCVHLPAEGTVETQSDRVVVTRGAARLDLLALQPPLSLLATSVTPFDNYSEDPESRLFMLSIDEVEPRFTVLLIPTRTGEAPPAVTTTYPFWGVRSELAWANGDVDIVFVNVPLGPGTTVPIADSLQAQSCGGPVSTDASLGVARLQGPALAGYVVVDATLLACGPVVLVAINNGPASLVYDGTNVHVSREDADFRIRADGVDGVFHHGWPVPTVLENGYLTNALVTGVVRDRAQSRLTLRAFPNPFNPSVRISFANPARGLVRAVLYDIAGRRVAVVASRTMDAGEQVLEWDGRDGAGMEAASGVYFLRVSAPGASESVKLVLLR
jgi:hypothetical protein